MCLSSSSFNYTSLKWYEVQLLAQQLRIVLEGVEVRIAIHKILPVLDLCIYQLQIGLEHVFIQVLCLPLLG